MWGAGQPQRQWGIGLWFGVALTVVIAVSAVTTLGDPAWQWVTGQRTLSGEAKWEDRIERPPLPYGAVDLRQVYGEPLTMFSVGLSRQEPHPMLQDALKDAPELWSLLAAVEQGAAEGLPFDGLAARVDAVNAATDAEGTAVWLHPWQQGGFYLKAYEVLADLQVPVGEASYRARYVRRLDTLAVREGRLGSVSDPEEGAIVLADRTRDFVVDEVWPALAPDPPESPLRAAMAPGVIYAVGDHLGGEALGHLRASGAVRRELLATLAAVEERAATCKTIRLSRPLWFGYDPDVIEQLRELAWRDRAKSTCAAITRGEVEVFDRAFRALVADDSGQEALRQLFGLAARGVLVHEARHAADEKLVCLDCPEGLEGTAMREASAYLASLQDERSAALSWLQMCTVATESRGAHARAARAVTSATQPEGCRGQMPSDVVDKAIEVDAAWFGPRPAVSLPATTPTALQLF